jgi:phosphoglycerate kinase
MHEVTDIDVRNKKVIVRADLDLAENNGKVETFRLDRLVPTIRNILDRGGSVRIIAHRGRPNGQVEKSLSLQGYVPLLSEKLGQGVKFGGDPIQNNNPGGDVNLFENLRFYPGEESNDPAFALSLSKLGELYVNESFATSHRPHASIVTLPKILPHFAGLNLVKEVSELNKVLYTPEHPLIVIIGGVKLETKRPIIDFMQDHADQILVGSSLASQGLVATDNVIIPTDSVGGGKDIGSSTVDHFRQIISTGKMIVWNGPLGVFEDPRFASGTRSIAQAIASSGAYSVVGGGDTIAAIDEIGLLDRISFVSTGGGAMLEFLSGKKLPGIIALG